MFWDWGLALGSVSVNIVLSRHARCRERTVLLDELQAIRVPEGFSTRLAKGRSVISERFVAAILATFQGEAIVDVGSGNSAGAALSRVPLCCEGGQLAPL